MSLLMNRLTLIHINTRRKKIIDLFSSQVWRGKTAFLPWTPFWVSPWTNTAQSPSGAVWKKKKGRFPQNNISSSFCLSCSSASPSNQEMKTTFSCTAVLLQSCFWNLSWGASKSKGPAGGHRDKPGVGLSKTAESIHEFHNLILPEEQISLLCDHVCCLNSLFLLHPLPSPQCLIP